MAYISGVTLPQKRFALFLECCVLSFSHYLTLIRAVIFIDEIDAIGNRNSNSLNSSNNHGTISQLLTCLDGITGRY